MSEIVSVKQLELQMEDGRWVSLGAGEMEAVAERLVSWMFGREDGHEG